MIAYYLKIAFRSFLKDKTSSIINIAGLTIGLSIVIATAIFINYELSYDSFHENGDRIYRVINRSADDKESFAGTPAPLGQFVESNIPEILSYTRLTRASQVVQYKNKKIQEEEFFFADPSFFEMFSFPLIGGEPASVLKDPNSMVITEKAAKKYFGSEDPVGKVVSLDGGFEFTITAVAKDVPANSHFHFELIVPFERIDDVMHTKNLEAWGNWNYFTYILTAKNTNAEMLKSKIGSLFRTKLPGRAGMFADLTYQPIKEIHFKFNRANLEPAFDDRYLTIFLAVAIAVLIIACINFINLSTARSIKRAKEVGLRKAVGANHTELVKQFFLESILLSVIASVLSVIMVELFLPAVNTITGKHYAIDYANVNSYLVFFGLVLLTGILAGVYPAMVLSSFNPVKALKGKLNQNSGASPRNILVVSQFTVSIALIICTIIIIQQINFIQTKNLGFAKEQIINIPLKTWGLINRSPVIKEELLKDKNILSASVNSYVPSSFNQHWGGFKWDGMSAKEENSQMWIIYADKDFIKTYQIEMIEGKEYAANFEATDKQAFILNKSAIKQMNWKTAVGKEITYLGSRKARIVGVMDDFNFRSLHHLVEPCAIVLSEKGMHVSVRIKAENITSSLASIKETWDSFGSNLPFDYYFLDDDFAKLYQSEARISSVLKYFSLFTVFIACIGLFGLTTFMAERRKKELGIRKVLGASSLGLLKQFSFDYTKWVILANVIACPIAYYFMKNWLQGFAYSIEISWWMFALAGGIALLVALVTISSQAIKAATANPVESLKYE